MPCNAHYYDTLMSPMASQITSLTIVYSTVYSGADKRKHQSTASLASQMASIAENVSIWWRHHASQNNAWLLGFQMTFIDFS